MDDRVIARNGDLSLWMETRGHGGDPVVVLVAGLATQLVWWPPGLVHALTVAGYRVGVFDHRDVGRSTHLEGTVSPAAVGRGMAPPPYRLTDMAGDVVAVIDAMEVPAAHLVGVSMGGAIAQETAIHHGSRVASLTSVMSSTGDPSIGGATRDAEAAVFRGPPVDRRGAIVARVATRRLLATPGCFDPAEAEAEAAWEHDRAFDPRGAGRQLAALLAAGDRTPALRTLEIPTLVIHGDADPLVDVSGGRATGAAVPGARYVEIRGMAHDLPRSKWPEILRPLLDHLDGAVRGTSSG